MQIYNAAYEQKNSLRSKEPRYVVTINFGSSSSPDIHYFTSHNDCLLPSGLSTSEYTHSVLRVKTMASQRLKPDDAVASIGNLVFELIDIDGAVTDVLRTKLEAGKGIRKKTAKLYKGFRGFSDFDIEYELQATQVVDGDLGFSQSTVSYTVKCLDPQHLMKTKIFELASTNITSTVAEDADVINVVSTTGFEMFEHDAGYDDAPNQIVVYLKLKKSKEEFEFVRCTGITATSFTGVTRGVLGTKPLEHEYTPGDESDRQIEVEEYVYLEGPILKIAYAILTGSLYGQPGKYLPGNWNLGIDASFVATSSFTGIGDDIWDTSDPSVGSQCRFQGISSEEGKRFFEKELMILAGCFHRVLNDGQIAVRRMANAAADASTVGVLDASRIVNKPTLTNGLSEVANIYAITWNWEDALGRYTRATAIGDGDSVSTHAVGEVKAYSFRGMYGNRMTVDRIYGRFDSLRAMYAGPPLTMTATCHGRVDMYEVGDSVRVSLDNVRDFTNGTQTTINRAFIVFGKQLNAKTGEVTYNLFGSSQDATALPAPSIQGLTSVLPDSFYSAGLNAANNIETMALAADPVNGFEVVEGVGILKTDITCTGVAGDIKDVDSVFWYDGDLEIQSGVTVTVVNGAQFRVLGYLENKGTISGVGGGHAGVSGHTLYDPFGTGLVTAAPGNPGVSGFIGSNEGGGTAFLGGGPAYLGGSNRSSPTLGANAVLPRLSVEYASGSLIGVPSDMRPSSGGAGGGAGYDGGGEYLEWHPGGAGGAGGAPVVIVSRGCSTLSGEINTSGADGVAGTLATGNLLYSGSGAGGCPAPVVIVTDGEANGFSGISKVVMEHGATPIVGTPMTEPYFLQEYNVTIPAYSYYTGSQNGSVNALITIHVVGEQTPEQDVPEITSNDTTPTLTEITNTPRSLAGNLSTIEITANDAGDSNYSHSIAYIRIKGQSAWARVNDPASPETTIVVVSDGTTYELHTRSVSTSGIESPGGGVAEITVSNVLTPTLSDPAPETLSGLQIPNVSGLELFEQGNDTTFTGKDAKFAWRHVSATEFYEIGKEPDGLGADAGTLDQYFQDYLVSVYDSATLLRQEVVTDNWYIYTFEKNAEDYKRINSSDGAYRSFRVEVVVRVTFTSAVSGTPAKLTVNNPAPELPTGVSVTGRFQQIVMRYNPPADLDWTGIRIWLGTSTGFTRDDATLVYDGPDTQPKLTRLADGSTLTSSNTYYLRFAPFDAFGKNGLNESAEYEVTLPVAITSNDVQSLIADKIAAGELGEVVTLGGVFIASGAGAVMNGTGPANGTWRLDMGPVTDGENTYIIRFHDNQGNSAFSIDSTGAAVFSGNLTLKDSGTEVLDIDGTNKAIWINSDTYGNEGVQLEYNGGTPRAHIGNKNGAGSYIEFDGTDLIAQTLKTSAGSGKRIELNPSGDNELHFYGDRGDGTIEELATVGITDSGSDYVIGDFGSTNSSRTAIKGVSYDGVGGYFSSDTYYSIYSLSYSGDAGLFESETGYCLFTKPYSSSTEPKSPLRLFPSDYSSAPTHSAFRGSLWLTSNCVLYINTSSTTIGSTWQKVGAQ